MPISQNTSAHCEQSGMTLLEVLVAMFIGVFVIGTATWFMVEGTRASFQAMAKVNNGVDQWGLATKLQVDGKVASGATIFLSADKTTWTPGTPALPVEVGVDDGNAANGLERGKILVLTKTQLNQGTDTKVVTDMIFYVFTNASPTATGILKRYPAKWPNTFAVTDPLDDKSNPKTVAALLAENFDTFMANAADVQDNLLALATNGPFAHFGAVNNVNIALLREETASGNVKNSNLSEVSFNLR